MDNNTIREVERLFNEFAEKEQASSFAVQNLLNRTLRIVQKGNSQQDVNNKIQSNKQ